MKTLLILTLFALVIAVASLVLNYIFKPTIDKDTLVDILSECDEIVLPDTVLLTKNITKAKKEKKK